MAAQKGSSLVIKIGNAASPEVFTAVTGLRTKSLSINAEEVDVSDADTPSKMRELLAGAGIISMAVAGSGVFKDGVTEETIRAEMLAQTIKNYQVVVPGQGTWEGAFQLTQLEYAGEHNGEVTWNLAMASAGLITYSAAA